jgi:hypothetical protein
LKEFSEAASNVKRFGDWFKSPFRLRKLMLLTSTFSCLFGGGGGGRKYIPFVKKIKLN